MRVAVGSAVGVAVAPLFFFHDAYATAAPRPASPHAHTGMGPTLRMMSDRVPLSPPVSANISSHRPSSTATRPATAGTDAAGPGRPAGGSRRPAAWAAQGRATDRLGAPCSP